MTKKKIDIYLQDKLFEAVTRNKHRLFKRIIGALKEREFETRVFKILPDTPYVAGLLVDYAILETLVVGRDNTFTLSRDAFPSYWNVQRTNDRQGMRIFHEKFDPLSVDSDEAEKFASNLREEFFGSPDHASETNEAVYVPLFGRITRASEGQIMSSVDMLQTVRRYEPDRDIIVSLSNRKELTKQDKAALKDVLSETGAKLAQAPDRDLIGRAKYTVTMNSIAGFRALTLGIPVLLFADADYHHVCVNLGDYDGDYETAFSAVNQSERNFDRYVKWYLEDHSIYARNADAVERILEALRQLGMDIPDVKADKTGTKRRT